MIYRIGYGCEDISPGLGAVGRVGLNHVLNLPGHPLSVKALSIHDGQSEALQITAEVVGLTGDVVRSIKTRLASEMGLERSQVILCATHTHAGPWVWTRQARDAAAHGITLIDETWIDHLIHACVKAGITARNEARPALIKVGAAEVREIASNRLVHGWRESITPDVDKRSLPEGAIDPQVRLFAVCEPDGNLRLMIANYACHPSGYGGAKVPFASPDFPYFAERRVSRLFGRPIPLIYWMGCAGDINTGKYCAEGSDLEVAGFGHRLGNALCQAWDSASPLEGSVRCQGTRQTFETGAWIESEKAARQHFDKLSIVLVKKLEAGKPLSDAEILPWRMALKRLDVCHLARNGGMPVELNCLSLGSLQLLFVPGEWFHRIGLRLATYGGLLTENLPAVWTTTLADFDLLYIPDEESRNHPDWYGVAPPMRTLSDSGIDSLLETTGALLDRSRQEGNSIKPD